MVKVLYGFKINALLGGVMFREGEAYFEVDEEGIRFAKMFHKNYEEVIPVATEPKKTTAKRKVKKDE